MFPRHIQRLLEKYPNLHVSTHPVVWDKCTKLVDKRTTPRRFREYLREISTLLMYEATANLALTRPTVETRLGGKWRGYGLKDKIGLAPILRAALGMVDGVHLVHPGAEVWHLGIYRDKTTKEAVWYYNKLPVSPTVDVVFILDPMLATANSAIAAADALKKWGAKRIMFVGLESTPEGVKAFSEAHPDIPIFLAWIGKRLDGNKYIREPDIGDAGDNQFGT